MPDFAGASGEAHLLAILELGHLVILAVLCADLVVGRLAADLVQALRRADDKVGRLGSTGEAVENLPRAGAAQEASLLGATPALVGKGVVG